MAPIAGPVLLSSMAGNTVLASMPLVGSLTYGGAATTTLAVSGVAGTAYAGSNIVEAETGFNPIKDTIYGGNDELFEEHQQILDTINTTTVIAGTVGTIDKVVQSTNNITKIQLPETKYSESKLQHEYKHAADFGIEGNWNKTKGIEYQQAIQNHINTSSDVYQSTYRGTDVYVYLDKNTGLGTYVDLQGNYIGGWKFSESQLQFHLNNGVKIK